MLDFSNDAYSDYEVIAGDSTESGLFKSPFIDLTVTSPPYNVGMDYNSRDDNFEYDSYLEFSRQWISNVYKWTKATGRFCLNAPLDKNKNGQQSVGADLTIIAKNIGWKYHSTVIWNEQNMSRRTAWGSWLSASAPYVIAPVELIIIFYKDVWKKNYKGESDISKENFIAWTNGVWSFNGESAKRIGHPAPFPKELPKRCIKLFSYKGDRIFDPFLGSGTTGLVAKELNRKFTGVEIDDEYRKLSLARMNLNQLELIP